MQRFSKQTYGEQVAQLIRQRIRNGKLRGGDSVGEAGLAESAASAVPPCVRLCINWKRKDCSCPIPSGADALRFLRRKEYGTVMN